MQPNPVGIHRVRTKLARTTIHIIHKRLVSTTKSRRTCYADQPTFGIYRIRNEVGTNMQWQVWVGLNCLASIATSLPRIKRSLRKRAPYRDLEEAPKRSGSDSMQENAWSSRKELLIWWIEYEARYALMQKVYQAFHCGSETCQLCYDRPRSQHAAPSLILNDSMCASRSIAPKQVLANMFFFSFSPFFGIAVYMFKLQGA